MASKLESVHRYLITVLILIATCATVIAQPPSEAERNFEHLWQTFDREYGIFGPKRIDWDALYAVYRPRVTSSTMDDQLFAVMSDMLGHLNDNHVMLMSDKPRRFYGAGYLGTLFADQGGFAAYQQAMSRRPVPERYFKSPLKEVGEQVTAYGWIAKDVGYIHFRNFEEAERT